MLWKFLITFCPVVQSLCNSLALPLIYFEDKKNMLPLQTKTRQMTLNICELWHDKYENVQMPALLPLVLLIL